MKQRFYACVDEELGQVAMGIDQRLEMFLPVLNVADPRIWDEKRMAELVKIHHRSGELINMVIQGITIGTLPSNEDKEREENALYHG